MTLTFLAWGGMLSQDVGYVRSATSGQAVDLSNYQPLSTSASYVFITMVRLKISDRYSIDHRDRLGDVVSVN